MIEEIVPFLTTVELVFVGLDNLVIKPSKEKIATLDENVLLLEEAYRRFEYQMNKIELQFKQGKLSDFQTKIRIEKSTVDETFLQLLDKEERIVAQLKKSGITDVINAAEALLLKTRNLFELWLKFEQAALLQDSRHIHGLFQYFWNEVKNFTLETKILVKSAQLGIAKKAGLFSNMVLNRDQKSDKARQIQKHMQEIEAIAQLKAKQARNNFTGTEQKATKQVQLKDYDTRPANLADERQRKQSTLIREQQEKRDALAREQQEERNSLAIAQQANRDILALEQQARRDTLALEQQTMRDSLAGAQPAMKATMAREQLAKRNALAREQRIEREALARAQKLERDVLAKEQQVERNILARAQQAERNTLASKLNHR